MSHLVLGTRLVPSGQVRITPTEIFGIRPKEATQVCYQLGLSENIRVNESTKYQINRLEQIISRGRNYVVCWELEKVKQADIE